MSEDSLASVRALASRYTAAWCSHNASSVASFFDPRGSLTINGGTPSVGRDAITQAAQGFMTDFPDLMVYMDDVVPHRDRFHYKWTLAGTKTGSGGSGNSVRISGYEDWRIGSDGLIAESLGHFDAAEYERQLKRGVL